MTCVKKRKQVKKYWKRWTKLSNEEAEVDILDETIDRAHRVGPNKEVIYKKE